MSSWDDEVGYDRGDPKHPDYAENAFARADEQRKRDRENGIGNPLVEGWQEEQAAVALEVGRCDYGAGETHGPDAGILAGRPRGRCICPVHHTGGHYVIAGRD